MHSKIKLRFSILGLSLGLWMACIASGCNDGCVRNSDCPMDYACTDAVCVPKHVDDAAADSESLDTDAGR